MGVDAADRRREVEHAAALVLADARTLDDAVPRILEAICSALGWEVGVLWTVRGGRLRCAELWRRPDEKLAAFEAACRDRVFAPGEGLPGRIWRSGEPVSVRDVVRDLNFPRAPAAQEAELHGAFGFPIVVRGETFGVMEFFTYARQDPDPAMPDMVATI